MEYIGDVYRPPSEASSFILQITIGCSHNQCTFCHMYKKDKFRMKSYEEIVEDILSLPEYVFSVRRIFLADGDALIMPTDTLVKVLKLLKQHFPKAKRIGIYASPRSIFTKTVEELKLLKEEGLGIVYLGVESGSGNILKMVHKGVTQEKMIECGNLVKQSGIPISVTLINGLGGVERSEEHAIESAKVMNALNPDYIGLLSLMITPGSGLQKDINDGKLTLLSPKALLNEIKLFIEHCELDGSIFRSNHASNYIPLRGVLNQDKNKIISQIEESLDLVDTVAKRKIQRF